MDASSEYTVAWFDRSAPVALGCFFLKACDTAQGQLWRTLGEAGAPMLGVWDEAAVMRKNEVRIAAADGATVPMDGVNRVRVTPRLARVGRTSWAVAFDIRDATAGGAAGALLAVVQTLMVRVDAATHSVALSLPNLEALRLLVGDGGGGGGGGGGGSGRGGSGGSSSAPTEEDGAFSWEERARLTDCDALGHVNNAVYATLLEEARAAAGRAGAYDAAAARLLPLPASARADEAGRVARVLVAAPAASMTIEYIDQVRPFDALRWTTWLRCERGAESAVFHFKLHVVNSGGAKALLATEGSIAIGMRGARAELRVGGSSSSSSSSL